MEKKMAAPVCKACGKNHRKGFCPPSPGNRAARKHRAKAKANTGFVHVERGRPIAGTGVPKGE